MGTIDFTRPKLISTSNDFFVDVALGKIPGYSLVNLAGINLNINATTVETFWDQGGDYKYLSADTQLYLSSSSASDTGFALVNTFSEAGVPQSLMLALILS